MINITKEEAMAIRNKYPETNISIANRNTSHKKYYVEETIKIISFLQKRKPKSVIHTNK